MDTQEYGSNDVGNAQAVLGENAAPAMRENEFSLKDVKREFFYGENRAELDAKLPLVVKAAAAAGLQPIHNFDPNEPVPEGYGIAILPVDKKNPVQGQPQIRVGVGIVAAPSAELLLQTEDAEVVKWRNETLLAHVLNRIANAMRPKEDGSLPASIPYTLHDFVTSSRPQTTAVWNEIAPPFLKVLQKRNETFKLVTKDMLRRMLSSAEYATQIAPTINQTIWVGIIKKMRELAEKKGKQTEVFDQMISTRDEAEFRLTADGFEDIEELDI